jgi:hypothetical protein
MGPLFENFKFNPDRSGEGVFHEQEKTQRQTELAIQEGESRP